MPERSSVIGDGQISKPGPIINFDCGVCSGSVLYLVNIMKTVEIIKSTNGQSVPLPEEFRFDTPTVSIRRAGDAVILEPIKLASWPDHFFAAIRIDDPAFVRPDQGVTPAAPSFD